MELTYLNGVIQAKYSDLFNPAILNNFKGLTKNSYLSLLDDYNYGISEKNDFEKIMLEAELKHKQFLESILNKNHLVYKVLYKNFDHIFLANLIKSFVLKIPYERLIKNLSTFNEKAFEDYVFLNIDTLISLEEKVFIDNLLNVSKGKDPKTISDIVYRVLNEEISNHLKTNDKAIIWYQQLDNTINNILTLIRTKRFNEDINYLKDNYIKDSLIEVDYLLPYYNLNSQSLGEYLSIHFNQDIKKYFNLSYDNINLNDLSNYFNQYLINNINPFNYDFDTLGPLIDLTLKKRQEIINLKQIYYDLGEI
ncbi:MAG: hypothetical protein WC907_04425 [Acholeplasmataceae bacterium]